MIRVSLPYHLRQLAGIAEKEVEVEVREPVTIRTTLDAVEARYPMLRGTIREHSTQTRRPFIRFFVCGEDMSHEPFDTLLPEAIVSGQEPLLIIGAIAGG